jgi:hypothetical protein
LTELGRPAYHALRMSQPHPQGQANLVTILLLIGLIAAGVWVWKRIPLDTQDYIIEEIIPGALLALAGVGLLVLAGRALWRKRAVRLQRERLIAKFERETGTDKRLDLAFTLIDLNGYRLEGLERVAAAMADLFMTTLKTALGDKRHRIRGMAASHLGVLQQKAAVPLLLAALEDDHAYVRGSAALGLGRMRAQEAKDKLAEVMKEDWDQTVRSRAREAYERMS